jgi:hypothetical protein
VKEGLTIIPVASRARGAELALVRQPEPIEWDEAAEEAAFTCALRLALSGEVYAPPALWYQVLAAQRPDGQDRTRGSCRGSALTEREADVLAELERWQEQQADRAQPLASPNRR